MGLRRATTRSATRRRPTLQQDTTMPITVDRQSVPERADRRCPATRSACCPASARTISFVDPEQDARRTCSSIRSTCSASCGGNLSVSVAYIGSTGRRLTDGAATSTSTSSIRSTCRSELVTALTQNGAEPVLRRRRTPARFATRATHPAQPAAAAVPAVRQRQHDARPTWASRSTTPA